MIKIKYEIDPHNRLVVEEGRGVEKFRTILDGSFKVDENNALSYHVKKSSGIDVPQQVKFSGNWSLDEDHRLVLVLDKWNNQVEGNKLVLEGALLDAMGSELAYSITTRDKADNERIYILKFSGKWQADKEGRLCFDVDNESGDVDRLTLRGTWKINDQNRIIYTHKQAALKTKEKIEDVITLKGYWDISGEDRLTYVLNKDLGSQFDFRVVFEKVTKDGLHFSIGIGAAPLKERFSLSGTWKMKKGLGLAFEAGYGEGRVRSINVVAKCPIFEDQGEAFLKALASRKEIAIVGGIGFRW
jgi:hypothetical protein